MSAEILHRLEQEGVVNAASLADCWSLAPSSCYPYFVERELSYSKLRDLFRHTGDPRIAEAFLSDLLGGTGFIYMNVPESLDLDGDGDIDTDDALKASIDQMGAAADALRKLHAANADGHIDAQEHAELRHYFDQVLAQAWLARNVLDYIEANAPRRRQARNGHRYASGALSLAKGGHQ